MSLNRDAFVEEAIDRVLTQYRESPNLLGLIRYDIGQIADVAVEIDSIPSFFDLDTAVGDQLTLLGKRLGWPRCHCVCTIEPVFGFACDGDNPNQQIIGFCEEQWPEVWGDSWGIIRQGIWADCRAAGSGDICFDDDEVYRGYLKARRYQAIQRYQFDDLMAAMAHVWGETTNAFTFRNGTVVVSPGRALNDREQRELPVALRVLPIAPGIRIDVHLYTGPVFGFGEGWTGFCEDAQWLCPEPIDPYACT
jgi:hypothetical protein